MIHFVGYFLDVDLKILHHVFEWCHVYFLCTLSPHDVTQGFRPRQFYHSQLPVHLVYAGPALPDPGVVEDLVLEARPDPGVDGPRHEGQLGGQDAQTDGIVHEFSPGTGEPLLDPVEFFLVDPAGKVDVQVVLVAAYGPVRDLDLHLFPFVVGQASVREGNGDAQETDPDLNFDVGLDVFPRLLRIEPKNYFADGQDALGQFAYEISSKCVEEGVQILSASPGVRMDEFQGFVALFFLKDVLRDALREVFPVSRLI
mmetsp:Transcript_43231/g.84950  ORF Transcript_43231/g.84950 Transcript_43231/m.84950 type:complete len:256 (-) Transcript_43231:749-1516(-)